MEAVIIIGTLVTLWIAVRISRGWGGSGYGHGYYGRGFRHRGEYYRYYSWHYHRRGQSWSEFLLVVVLLVVTTGFLYVGYVAVK